MTRQSMEARTLGEPGPECYCGSELKKVTLPADLAQLSGRKFIWVHVETGDTECYPGEADPGTAVPLPPEPPSAALGEMIHDPGSRNRMTLMQGVTDGR